MAAVAVLHPQDAFHQNPALKPRRPYYDPASLITNPPATVNGGRRSPPSKRRKGSPTKKDAATAAVNPSPKPRSTPKPNTSSPVMGQVKILKRGENLPVPEKVNAAPLVSHKSLEKPMTPAKAAPLVSHRSLEKSTPTPARSSQRHLKFQHAFAGSAASTSPEPSALPVPSFCSKKMNNPNISAELVLRQILGL